MTSPADDLTDCEQNAAADARPIVLEARNLVKRYRLASGRGPIGGRHRSFNAVDDVSLSLRRGRVTALVGQSGSGKSTVARLLAQLIPQTSGEILLDGDPVKPGSSRAFRRYCGSVQMILQDPFGSLNPLHRVELIVGAAVKIHHPALGKDARREKVSSLLEHVNLQPADHYVQRFPHELSGGERQRVSIARALAADPRVLLADEPVSMLDVTIRRETLDMIDRLRREADLAVLYITHDLASAQSYADETLVMHNGVVVERGDSQRVATHPQHEYTQRLLAAAPDPTRRRR